MSDELHGYRLAWSLATGGPERLEHYEDLDEQYDRVLDLLQLHGNLGLVELRGPFSDHDLDVYCTDEYLMWRPDENHVGFVTGREVLKAIAQHEDVLFAHSVDVQHGNSEF